MKKIRRTDFIIIAVLLAAVIGITLTVMSGTDSGKSKTSADPAGASKILTAEDCNGRKIGIKTGSSFESITFEKFPDSEYLYIENYSDMATALKSGKIDGFLTDEPVARMMSAEQSGIGYLKENIIGDDYHFCFPKGTERSNRTRTEFDTLLSELRESGELDKMKDKWLGSDEKAKTLDDTKLTGENGTVNVVTLDDNVPFSYIADNKLKGYAIELITRFAEKYGYDVKYEYGTVASCLAGISSGKYDILAGSVSVTEERAQSMDFSDVIYEGGVSLVVRAEDIGGESAVGAPDYTDYNGRRMGIHTGAVTEGMTLELFPDSEYSYYNSATDLIAALQNNKIDGFIEDINVARMIHESQNDVDYIKNKLSDIDTYVGFPKNEEKYGKLKQQFNTHLAGLKESGELDKITDKWLGNDDSTKTFDESGLTGENGTLSVAVMTDSPPFSYIENNKLQGYMIEVMTEFAREYGYKLSYEYVDLTAGLAGLTTEKYDIFATFLVMNEERKQSIDFSDAVYNCSHVLVVRSSDLSGSTAPQDKLIPAVTLDELDDPDRTVGVMTGATGMLAVEKYLPNADMLLFNELSTAFEAVKTGQINALVFDKKQLQIALSSGLDGVMLLNDDLGDKIEIAVGLSRQSESSGLKDSINRFIAEKKADGTFDDAFRRWANDKNYTMPDIKPAASPRFTIVVGTSGLVEPYSFYKDNELTGLDIEISKRFAAWLGADIEYKVMDYSGLIPAAQSDSIDFIFANLNVTDERKQAIDFSDTIYNVENGIMVRTASAQQTDTDESWLDGILSSFEKNFIREDRYKLILEGVGTTCAITLLSVLFGSVLAFLICLFRRTDSLLANKTANIYVRLLQGTPIVVLLMILYYIVFGKSGLSAVWVAVIGFSLNFAAYVSETLRSGIESIDSGQREAALALGFSENQTFFRFIFPQAAVRQFPVYRGEIISLLKSTSIVGYIAIQDLTKMSDIIRSRTYEAFFPLIATAVIYFIIAWIITVLLGIILKRIDPRSKRRAAK